MRGDMLSENSALWDPAAYRVLFHAHPRTGDAWCIYPTYDYTHCIVDSLEDISHSLCTLEFGQRQAVDGPYYWLLHALRLYKPVTWEYSRLNITHTLMSKRKLKFLVEGGFVCGWDDPRLPTIEGLRRRGFSAAMLNRFCDEDGVTEAGRWECERRLPHASSRGQVGVTKAAMTARWQVVEHVARTALDASAPRRFAVLRPLKAQPLRARSAGAGASAPAAQRLPPRRWSCAVSRRAGSRSSRRTTRGTQRWAPGGSCCPRPSTSTATTFARREPPSRFPGPRAAPSAQPRYRGGSAHASGWGAPTRPRLRRWTRRASSASRPGRRLACSAPA